MLRKNRMNNRGQITIFVILAMIIVVSLIIFFILIRKPSLEIQDVENPQSYIDGCISDLTKEAVNLLSEQGGDIDPEGSVRYKGRDITYLCYNKNYYELCINQRPMLIKHIENEITNYIRPKVNNCFNSLESKLKQKNYDIEMGGMELKTTLKTNQILVEASRDFTMTKNGNTRKFKDFKMTLIHPLYDLAEIANEITNQEAKSCDFDYLKFIILNAKFDINKFVTGDSDKIYIITEKLSKEKFEFAIRGCLIPS